VSGAPAFARALSRDAAFASVALGRSLHAAGIPVTPDRSATFAAAARLVGAGERDDLYWAARLSFVTSRDQLADFDAVFAGLVDGLVDPAGAPRGDPNAPAPARRPARRPHRSPGAPESPGASGTPGPATRGTPDDDAARDGVVGARASDVERLAQLRLDALDDAELAIVRRLLARMPLATPPRRGRRARTANRGERLDVRATLRASRRTGGDPVDRLRRHRRQRPRPLVALLDVSGSMAPYARAYLLLMESAARAARAETFVFATRLTRVTRALKEGRAQTALERASRAAPDWAGGTRIGEALRAFNDRFGRRGMARGAVVVVLSDGWERGDPALVGREMERLARLAHRIVWVNPRMAAPGFAPLTGGMAAALPHVDDLVSGHSVAALDAVVEAIGRHR
jgi:uncharacterized protein with von Willebrand factor type A (vWA) domain